MGKRDDLIMQYADDLKNKCSMTPDMVLLTKVTIGCGPAIYNADASTGAGSQPSELETVQLAFAHDHQSHSHTPILVQTGKCDISTLQIWDIIALRLQNTVQ